MAYYTTTLFEASIFNFVGVSKKGNPFSMLKVEGKQVGCRFNTKFQVADPVVEQIMAQPFSAGSTIEVTYDPRGNQYNEYTLWAIRVIEACEFTKPEIGERKMKPKADNPAQQGEGAQQRQTFLRRAQ